MKKPVRSPFPPFNRRLLGLAVGSTLLLGVATTQANAQVVFGLSGSDLTSVNLASPFNSQTRVAITGVTAGQTLVGLDFRPATGELFAMGYDASTAGANTRLYVINQTTAVATPVGAAAIRLELGGSSERIAFDFNPTVDRIRVTGTNERNYRLNPNNGALAATDTDLAFVATDANAGQNPAVGAAGYTNSFIGTATTTLYYIDEQRSLLLRSDNPNGGSLATVATLNPQAGGNATPINAPGASTDLDIFQTGVNDQQAYLNVNQIDGGGNFVSLLYRLNLANGTTTLAGVINGTGVGITDIAVRINRTAPAPSGQLLYGVTTGNSLISFYSGTPGFINTSVAISGIAAGQTLVGTDFRPNTGQLIGLGYDATTAGANSQLYVIEPATGVATAIAAAIRLELGGPTDNIGFDFNPTVDRIRVVSTNRADYRLNPNNGALAATDGLLTYAATDPNAAATPRIGAVGYTNSYPGSTSTTLYDIDEALSILAIQNPPNSGTLNTVGNNTGLTLSSSNALVDLDIYFDRSTSVNRAFLTANPGGQATSNLYSMDLGSGNPTLTGAIGLGVPVRDVSALLSGADASAALSGRLLYGVAGGNLVSFDSGNPSVIRTAVNITGLPADGSQVLAGADFRPATGELYALGYNAATQQGQLYTVNLTTGALTATGSLTAMALGATTANIGFDFNPTVDLIRVTSGTNQANLRVSPVTGAVTIDTNLSNPSGAPVLTGAAYTNNDNNANTGTMLYGIDQTRSVLLRSTNANAGTYVDQGSLSVTLNTALGSDFDIYSDLTNVATPGNAAFLSAAAAGTTTDNLYTVDLTAGSASLVGRIGSGSNLTGLAAFLTPGPVIPAGLTWTGAVSTDWGTAGNWSPAQVPTATDNVTIPDVANDPVVSNGQQANNVTLASGATLTTANGGTLTVSGNFTNNGGTTLGSGTGTLAFTGAAAQTIGGTGTTFINNLTAGPAGLTATSPVQVQRVLLLNGNLASNGNLTLLSNAAGTAHVVNNGGVVTGNTAVQRYIDGGLNGGSGYRHYSAPVAGSTVADLATSGYSPVVNPAYNTAPVPGTVTPFPTVFGYDQARVNTSGNPAPQDFDKGFFSPGSTTDALTVGCGYTVNIPASQTVNFVGELNNGPITASGLSRGTQTESGWQLLGNPYPSPINWDLVGRTNVDAAVYVYRSTGPYAGTYSSYVANGAGTNGGTAVIGSGQGFFTRVSTPGSGNGQVAFANAARLTSYASPVFQRGTALNAPLVRLDLRAGAGAADETVVYFDQNATAGFDPAMDAYKLQAGSTPVLASELNAATHLSINALPVLSAADRTIALHVAATQAGSHTLRAVELQNLPAGTFAYLRDAQTNTIVDLATQPEYTFQLAAGTATGRFSLLLTQQRILGNASAALSQQVSVFPNPARGAVSISLPAALTRQATEVQLLNSLGQTVLRTTLPAGSAAVRNVSLTGVSQGVYTLRLQTSEGSISKRLVLE
ncbi:DUF4394 domain-containing protein [Hymenobacter psychrotolerans]|uniref:Por secretion system C-terminal sorting domain-containing protein n=1 Tax=Hymenobacter psychrotolerans DSM 18569 TaxID=1121959 RepID=A0A1M6X7N2_9BACT|nr:DUF4394 domain-containing protein [Hymenobacter psychrotolerans]SHL01997.1 Por secretion system C-terminal sorting domain-containing protein [Hymenobacter psychrotolerans DSM 18569]